MVLSLVFCSAMKILATYVFPFQRLSSVFIGNVGEEMEYIAILFLVQRLIREQRPGEETIKGYYPCLLLTGAPLSCPWLLTHQARELGHQPGSQGVHLSCATCSREENVFSCMHRGRQTVSRWCEQMISFLIFILF